MGVALPTTVMAMPQGPTHPTRSRLKSSISGQRIVSRESQKGIRAVARRRFSWWFLAALASTICLVISLLSNWLAEHSYTHLFSKAEEAARTGNWRAAQGYWREINSTSSATSASHLGEARSCLALGQAAQAERSLRRAIVADPSEPDGWRLLLQIFQVEDRTIDALRLGWQAHHQVSPQARRELLWQLTLTILTDLLPDEKIRTTLQRWVEADGNDVNAATALLQRIAAQPRAGDPDRPSLLARLKDLVAKYPNHPGVREALVTVLADSGQPDQGRLVLDAWPNLQRDARYWRLYGRWELDYEHRPQQAVEAFQTALKELPQDWRSWYRLARALHSLHRQNESHQATETVRRIREVIDPLVLGPRLNVAFDHLDDPHALADLAALCNQVGLTQLTSAWLTEAQHVNETSGDSQP
jgi:predicted Zn-dependent protease